MSRPIWQGSIAFGLVNIPIAMQTAVREKSVSFHLLSKDGSCRLKRKLYCPETGEEVDYDQTARGIEVGKDQYVVVDEKEIESLRPEKGKAIDIEQFVELDEIDPIYFDRAYFVTPSKGSDKAYRLLVDAMKQAGRVGLARFVMRGRQYLAAVRAMDDGLVLHTMHYRDEVLSLEETLSSKTTSAKVPEKELKIAGQLIESMTHELDLSGYKDDYREQLENLIEQKKRGRKTVSPSDDHDESPAAPTINLMEALRKSLASGKSARGSAKTLHRKSA